MLPYALIYLTLILTCGALTADASLTQSYFPCASMATNQAHSKKLIPQIESELKAVRRETKFDAYKPFFEPIGDHWIGLYVGHCNTPHNKIADSASLKLKSEHLVIPGALWWQPPQMPLRLLAYCDIAMVDVDATATLAFETLSARLMTHYTLAESNSSNSRIQHQRTGCSARSSAFLMSQKAEIVFKVEIAYRMSAQNTRPCHHRSGAFAYSAVTIQYYMPPESLPPWPICPSSYDSLLTHLSRQ